MLCGLENRRWCCAALAIVMLAGAFHLCCPEFEAQHCCAHDACGDSGSSAADPHSAELLEMGLSSEGGAPGHNEAGVCQCPCHAPVLTAMSFDLQQAVAVIDLASRLTGGPQPTPPRRIDHPPRHA
jgi:hypothetical protein